MWGWLYWGSGVRAWKPLGWLSPSLAQESELKSLWNQKTEKRSGPPSSGSGAPSPMPTVWPSSKFTLPQSLEHFYLEWRGHQWPQSLSVLPLVFSGSLQQGGKVFSDTDLSHTKELKAEQEKPKFTLFLSSWGLALLIGVASKDNGTPPYFLKILYAKGGGWVWL